MKSTKHRLRSGQTKLRVAIYARKSAEDERQSSLPTQIQMCRDFVAQYDFMEIVKVFQEDNKSGMSKDNRTEFLEMLNLAAKKDIDAIVAIRYDRIARDIGLIIETQKTLAAVRLSSHCWR